MSSVIFRNTLILVIAPKKTYILSILFDFMVLCVCDYERRYAITYIDYIKFIKETEVTMIVHVDYNADINLKNTNKNNNRKTDDNKLAIEQLQDNIINTNNSFTRIA